MAQSSVLEAVEKSEKATLKLEKSVPEKAAERVGLNTEKVAVQVNKLQQKLKDIAQRLPSLTKLLTN